MKFNHREMNEVDKRLIEIENDLLVTEKLFKLTNKDSKLAINKLRIPIIVEYNNLKHDKRRYS